MARIKIKERVLEALGFARVEPEDGMHYYVLSLHRGWTIEYTDGIVELVHEGYAVPLNCRGEKHLRQIIQVL